VTGAEDLVHAFDGLASRVDATGFRSVGFTSALQGEGVSTLALGTALSLAALREEDVLLVDANWIDPSLTRDAGAESAAGLAEHLVNTADLATVIRPTARPRLSFLPVGDRGRGRPTLRALSSLLAGDAIARRTVVVDLPPILAGEPFVLPWAALLDQLFVVLREAATPLPVVRQALARIGLATTPQIVLNRTVAASAEIAAALAAVRT
jgi:Mrp family chromosome partitioning ATPase